MQEKIKKYVEKFNYYDNNDGNLYISNGNTAGWMAEEIPLIDIPDKTMEEIYYFRWWMYRKHIKNTEDGFVITEFLKDVPWSGKHNTIIAAAGHHISEGKWLKSGNKILFDYIKFWLDEKSNTYSYSSWLAYSIYELCVFYNDFSFAINNLNLIERYFINLYNGHITDCRLFWSYDDNDAMEFSISGTSKNMNKTKGIRPTLNSYMAANAYALSEFFKRADEPDLSEKYKKIYLRIKDKLNLLLWDKNFYKAIHLNDLSSPSLDKVPDEQNVKELIGYIPWNFNIPPSGYEIAFNWLKENKGFKSKYGFTTAEQRHPRFMYKADHECLWNGYIWPFATSQVFNSVINLMNNYNSDVITENEFYDMVLVYAKSHYLTGYKGEKICWIDEAKDPLTNIWSCREILKKMGWQANLGGCERGKDYNHSTYCDIILRGILGISIKNGSISVSPRIPEKWDKFSVDNIILNDTVYKITYCKKEGINIQRSRN